MTDSAYLYPTHLFNEDERENLKEFFGRDLFSGSYSTFDLTEEQLDQITARIMPRARTSIRATELLPSLRKLKALTDTEYSHLRSGSLEREEMAIRLIDYLMYKGMYGLSSLYLSLLTSSESRGGVPAHYQLARELREIVQEYCDDANEQELGEGLTEGVGRAGGGGGGVGSDSQVISLKAAVRRLRGINLSLAEAQSFALHLSIPSQHQAPPTTDLGELCGLWSRSKVICDVTELVEGLLVVEGLGRYTSHLCGSLAIAPRDLRTFLLTLREEWVVIARYLGFADEEVEAILSSSPDSATNQVEQFLHQWKVPDLGQKLLPIMRKVKGLAGIVEPKRPRTNSLPSGRRTWRDESGLPPRRLDSYPHSHTRPRPPPAPPPRPHSDHHSHSHHHHIHHSPSCPFHHNNSGGGGGGRHDQKVEGYYDDYEEDPEFTTLSGTLPGNGGPLRLTILAIGGKGLRTAFNNPGGGSRSRSHDNNFTTTDDGPIIEELDSDSEEVPHSKPRLAITEGKTNTTADAPKSSRPSPSSSSSSSSSSSTSSSVTPKLSSQERSSTAGGGGSSSPVVRRSRTEPHNLLGNEVLTEQPSGSLNHSRRRETEHLNHSFLGNEVILEGPRSLGSGNPRGVRREREGGVGSSAPLGNEVLFDGPASLRGRGTVSSVGLLGNEVAPPQTSVGDEIPVQEDRGGAERAGGVGGGGREAVSGTSSKGGVPMPRFDSRRSEVKNPPITCGNEVPIPVARRFTKRVIAVGGGSHMTSGQSRSPYGNEVELSDSGYTTVSGESTLSTSPSRYVSQRPPLMSDSSVDSITAVVSSGEHQTTGDITGAGVGDGGGNGGGVTEGESAVPLNRAPSLDNDLSGSDVVVEEEVEEVEEVVGFRSRVPTDQYRESSSSLPPLLLNYSSVQNSTINPSSLHSVSNSSNTSTLAPPSSAPSDLEGGGRRDGERGGGGGRGNVEEEDNDLDFEEDIPTETELSHKRPHPIPVTSISTVREEKDEEREEEEEETMDNDLSVISPVTSGTDRLSPNFMPPPIPDNDVSLSVTATPVNEATEETKEYCSDDILQVVQERDGIDLLTALVVSGAKVNLPGRDGSYPLHLAVSRGLHETVLFLLLNSDANVNHKRTDGKTALHLACLSRDFEMVQILVEKGVDLEAQDNDGYTAMHLRMTLESPNIVRYLALHGAPVDTPSHESQLTPLMICCHIGDGVFETAQFLIGHGARVDGSPQVGMKPLIIVSEEGFEVLLDLLVESNADINIQDHEGNTPLVKACQRGHVRIIKKLCERRSDTNSSGANVNLPNNEGLTPLLAAVLSNNRELVPVLISYSANINCHKVQRLRVGERGEVAVEVTPLSCAAASGNIEMVQLLTQNEATINASPDGQVTLSPLAVAAMCGHLNVVKFLLNLNDLDLSLPAIAQPMVEAVRAGHFECAKVISTKNYSTLDEMYDTAEHHGLTELATAIRQLQQKVASLPESSSSTTNQAGAPPSPASSRHPVTSRPTPASSSDPPLIRRDEEEDDEDENNLDGEDPTPIGPGDSVGPPTHLTPTPKPLLLSVPPPLPPPPPPPPGSSSQAQIDESEENNLNDDFEDSSTFNAASTEPSSMPLPPPPPPSTTTTPGPNAIPSALSLLELNNLDAFDENGIEPASTGTASVGIDGGIRSDGASEEVERFREKRVPLPPFSAATVSSTPVVLPASTRDDTLAVVNNLDTDSALNEENNLDQDDGEEEDEIYRDGIGRGGTRREEEASSRTGATAGRTSQSGSSRPSEVLSTTPAEMEDKVLNTMALENNLDAEEGGTVSTTTSTEPNLPPLSSTEQEAENDLSVDSLTSNTASQAQESGIQGNLSRGTSVDNPLTLAQENNLDSEEVSSPGNFGIGGNNVVMNPQARDTTGRQIAASCASSTSLPNHRTGGVEESNNLDVTESHHSMPELNDFDSQEPLTTERGASINTDLHQRPDPITVENNLDDIDPGMTSPFQPSTSTSVGPLMTEEENNIEGLNNLDVEDDGGLVQMSTQTSRSIGHDSVTNNFDVQPEDVVPQSVVGLATPHLTPHNSLESGGGGGGSTGLATTRPGSNVLYAPPPPVSMTSELRSSSSAASRVAPQQPNSSSITVADHSLTEENKFDEDIARNNETRFEGNWQDSPPTSAPEQRHVRFAEADGIRGGREVVARHPLPTSAPVVLSQSGPPLRASVENTSFTGSQSSSTATPLAGENLFAPRPKSPPTRGPSPPPQNPYNLMTMGGPSMGGFGMVGGGGVGRESAEVLHDFAQMCMMAAVRNKDQEFLINKAVSTGYAHMTEFFLKYFHDSMSLSGGKLVADFFGGNPSPLNFLIAGRLINQVSFQDAAKDLGQPELMNDFAVALHQFPSSDSLPYTGDEIAEALFSQTFCIGHRYPNPGSLLTSSSSFSSSPPSSSSSWDSSTSSTTPSSFPGQGHTLGRRGAPKDNSSNYSNLSNPAFNPTTPASLPTSLSDSAHPTHTPPAPSSSLHTDSLPTNSVLPNVEGESESVSTTTEVESSTTTKSCPPPQPPMSLFDPSPPHLSSSSSSSFSQPAFSPINHQSNPPIHLSTPEDGDQLLGNEVPEANAPSFPPPPPPPLPPQIPPTPSPPSSPPTSYPPPATLPIYSERTLTPLTPTPPPHDASISLSSSSIHNHPPPPPLSTNGRPSHSQHYRESDTSLTPSPDHQVVSTAPRKKLPNPVQDVHQPPTKTKTTTSSVNTTSRQTTTKTTMSLSSIKTTEAIMADKAASPTVELTPWTPSENEEVVSPQSSSGFISPISRSPVLHLTPVKQYPQSDGSGGVVIRKSGRKSTSSTKPRVDGPNPKLKSTGPSSPVTTRSATSRRMASIGTPSSGRTATTQTLAKPKTASGLIRPQFTSRVVTDPSSTSKIPPSRSPRMTKKPSQLSSTDTTTSLKSRRALSGRTVGKLSDKTPGAKVFSAHHTNKQGTAKARVSGIPTRLGNPQRRLPPTSEVPTRKTLKTPSAPSTPRTALSSASSSTTSLVDHEGSNTRLEPRDVVRPHPSSENPRNGRDRITSSVRESSRLSFPDIVIQDPENSPLLKALSHRIIKWKIIGRYLGCSDEELDHIERCEKDTNKRSHRMLVTWSQKHGGSYHELEAAIHNIMRESLVEDLRPFLPQIEEQQDYYYEEEERGNILHFSHFRLHNNDPQIFSQLSKSVIRFLRRKSRTEQDRILLKFSHEKLKPLQVYLPVTLSDSDSSSIDYCDLSVVRELCLAAQYHHSVSTVDLVFEYCVQ